MSRLDSDDIFDRAMRDRYRQALQHVSSGTRARLGANRHAATRGDSMPARGWPLGAMLGGFAALLFAITLGLNFNQGTRLGDDGRTASTTTGGMRSAPASELPPVTALDEDPEFYAWLGSSDAQLMAME